MENDGLGRGGRLDPAFEEVAVKREVERTSFSLAVSEIVAAIKRAKSVVMGLMKRSGNDRDGARKTRKKEVVLTGDVPALGGDGKGGTKKRNTACDGGWRWWERTAKDSSPSSSPAMANVTRSDGSHVARHTQSPSRRPVPRPIRLQPPRRQLLSTMAPDGE